MPQPAKHKSANKKEIKRINLAECKLSVPDAANSTMEFSGYSAVFSNVDSYGDMIEPGAFSAYLDDVKSGKQNWPSMLKQHGGWGVNADDMTPLGVYTDLSEDSIGLKTDGKLAQTPKGEEIYTLMKMQPRPAITGLSIGYYVRQEAYGGKNDAFNRLIKQIDLLEISIVTFPANDKARISGVKSFQALTEREFEYLLRDVAGLSQREAKTVISRGFKALMTERDAGSDELKHMAALIERNANIFKLQEN